VSVLESAQSTFGKFQLGGGESVFAQLNLTTGEHTDGYTRNLLPLKPRDHSNQLDQQVRRLPVDDKQGTISYCIDDLVPIVLVEFFVFRHQHHFGSTIAPGRHHSGFCRYPPLLNVGLAAATPNIGSFRFGNKFVESKLNFAKETDVLFSEFVHKSLCL
jgi:hypothetical protein